MRLDLYLGHRTWRPALLKTPHRSVCHSIAANTLRPGVVRVQDDACVKFARGLDVTIDQISPSIAQQMKDAWAWTDDVSPIDSVPMSVDQPESDVIAIPCVSIKVDACISGYTTETLSGDEFCGCVYLPQSFLKLHRYEAGSLVATRVAGDSMTPRILEGDILVLNTADIERKDGALYGFSHAGQFVVKRLVKRGADWYLSSDNEEYAPVRAAESTLIVGRVVMMVCNEP